MSRKYVKWFLSVMALISWASCQQDVEKKWDGQLSGRWELNWAQVNNANTDRLRNLYFVFLPDTSMQTNILGSERNYKYTVKEDIITQAGDPQLTYRITEVTDSTMTMETEIRGSVFTIYLDKARPRVITEN